MSSNEYALLVLKKNGPNVKDIEPIQVLSRLEHVLNNHLVRRSQIVH